MALARGQAKASRKKWGAYYECWRATYNPETKQVDYCMPCFHHSPVNEWYLTQETHADDFTTHGENGGSSRLLQERIYYHALLSGADYFGEEWGLNCSYTDMHDWTLSKYGEVKKQFIHAAAGIHGIKAQTPFAVVLPLDYACVEMPRISKRIAPGTIDRRGEYMSLPLSAADAERYGHIEGVLTLLFHRLTDGISGNEGHVLTNGRFGDVFDIIYADAPAGALDAYDYLIDATQEGEFFKKQEATSRKVLKSDDLGVLAHTLDTLIPTVMPVTISGLHWLVSTDDRGRRFLTIFNNEGNLRTSAKGDEIDRSCDKRIDIVLNVPGALEIFKPAREDLHLERIDDRTYRATVAAADFVVFTF